MAGDDDNKTPDPVAELRAEVTARFDQLGAALEELKSARTPPERREARRDVGEARDDVESALRKAGYKFTRDDLDKFAEEQDYALFRSRWKRFMEEQKAEGGTDGGDDKGKGKTKEKATAGKSTGDDDEPPANRGGWFRM